MKYRRLQKYKYQLVESVHIYFKDIEFNIDNTFEDVVMINKYVYLEKDNIYISKGYAWDGATCALDTDTFMISSLIHDALYQLISENQLDKSERIKADQILKQLCIEFGMNKIRANYVYLAVRLFGGLFLNKKTKDKIYEV